MSLSKQPPRPDSRLTASLTLTSLLAAAAWLVIHIWLGVGFTDEMQYYGEISSLVQHGRFFQDDMFLQQLGYLFLLPFFKLHALLYSDQAYFVLFARCLLLAAYGLTALVFWRAISRLDLFSANQKRVGLAAFLAWVPFQIFAFSYNTTSYLLVVLLLAEWIGRQPGKNRRYVLTTAILLTILTYTYPTVGLGLILVAVIEADRRLNRRTALHLLGTTALLGGAVLALIAALQGAGFIPDLLASLDFSRRFGVGGALSALDQFTGLALVALIVGCFLRRWRHGGPFRYPLGAESPPALRWTMLAALVVVGGGLLGLIANWRTGFFAATLLPGLLVLMAASVPAPDAEAPVWQAGSRALFRRALLIAIAVGCTALLVTGLRWDTGYFATLVYLVLLILLVAFAERGDGPDAARLAGLGGMLGLVGAVTSSNGAHNFGIGAAPVIPFLFLFGARTAGQAGQDGARRLIGPAIPCLILLWLLNAALKPYGEQPVWNSFRSIAGVPALRGIWTSPVKVEAVQRFQALSAPGALRGKRLLVLGPHPWLYFVLGGQAATPMRYLHYTGRKEAYTLVADWLFRGGEPDVIVVTNAAMPPQIAAKLREWTRRDFTAQKLALPPDFIDRYKKETAIDFSPEIVLLGRPAFHP